MAGSFATIDVENADGVMTIALNRPDALNAFTAEMGVELSAALRVAQREATVRCVVVTGRGRAFCVGQDLREVPAAQPEAASESGTRDLGDYVREHVSPVALRLRSMEKPVIAAINGVAAGAGVGFALAADLRIAGRSAAFKLAFIHVGLVPDAAATFSLVQQIGYARAAELCMLSEPVTAERALALGLVNRVVDDNELDGAVREWALKLAAMPAEALALTKRALNRAWTATLEEQLDYEAFLQGTLSRTADHREGVAAFLEKRPPKFGL